jgi:hypothetical protein
VDRALETTNGNPALAFVRPEIFEYAARLALARGDAKRAITLARDAIRIADAQFGSTVANAYAGGARLTLGSALVLEGRLAEARDELERAASDLEQAAGETHPWSVNARSRLLATTR